jgi:hypothetical protein
VSRRPWPAAALALLLCAALGAASDSERRDPVQSSRDMSLPFGLKERELETVKLGLGFYSSGIGAGAEEIWIHGDGRVVLRKTAHAEAEPETREGRVPATSAIALLALFESERFLDWPMQAPPKGERGGRTLILRLALPSGERQVAVDGEEPEGFAHLVGAVKAVAASALPETLGERFFSSL